MIERKNVETIRGKIFGGLISDVSEINRNPLPAIDRASKNTTQSRIIGRIDHMKTKSLAKSLAKCLMNLTIDIQELREASARGAKVEEIVGQAILDQLRHAGYKEAQIIDQPKKPSEKVLMDKTTDPAVVVTNRLFGSKKEGTLASLMNRNDCMAVPGERACPTTLVRQPFGGTQGSIDFLLLNKGRRLLISVKGWDGSATIMQNSAMSHAGVLYVCIRNNANKAAKYSNFIYLGADLCKELVQQRDISQQQGFAARAIQTSQNPAPKISNDHRNNRLVDVGRTQAHLIELYGDLQTAAQKSIEKGLSGKWVTPKIVQRSQQHIGLTALCAVAEAAIKDLDQTNAEACEIHNRFLADITRVRDWLKQQDKAAPADSAGMRADIHKEP